MFSRKIVCVHAHSFYDYFVYFYRQKRDLIKTKSYFFFLFVELNLLIKSDLICQFVSCVFVANFLKPKKRRKRKMEKEVLVPLHCIRATVNIRRVSIRRHFSLLFFFGSNELCPRSLNNKAMAIQMENKVSN